MNMKKIILVSMLLLAFIVPSKNVTANATTMYVEPQIITVEIFTTFQVNVSVSQVVDLAAWEFKLYYHNEYLNATQIHEGQFLKTAGQTSFFVKNFTDNYNSTHGMIWAFCTLIGQGPGATGSGALATMTFKAKLSGVTTLYMLETDMLDSKMPPNHITHTTADGTVNILGHDVAVTDVAPLKTIVGQGYSMHINVTVENQGDYTETFNVTLYANTTIIETKTNITLTSGNSTTLTIPWNTTGVAKGNYMIWAYATPVPGETDTLDNTFTAGLVYVVIPGDINNDDMVDIYDLILVASAFGSTADEATYNPNADINNDGTIDIYDLIIVASNFGETDP